MAAITADELRQWSSITATDPGTTAALDEVVATTNSVIARRCRPTVLDNEAELHTAALILAARTYKRRASPEGVAGLGDLGVIRIAPRDDDVEALLSPWLKVPLA